MQVACVQFSSSLTYRASTTRQGNRSHGTDTAGKLVESEVGLGANVEIRPWLLNCCGFAFTSGDQQGEAYSTHDLTNEL